MSNIKDKYFLPVEALTDSLIKFIEETPTLFDTIKDECVTNNLSKTITFIRTEGKDWEIAEIKKEENGFFCVSIHINFAQFLWSVGLYLLVSFDNMVQIPMMDTAKCNIHKYKCDKNLCEMALENYKRAREFMYEGNRDLPWHAPNIVYPDSYKEIIGKANSIYLGAMTFIYAHEVFHNYFGHTQVDSNSAQSIKDELDADESAIETILSKIPQFKETEYKLGIIVVMFAILFLHKEYLSGGNSHPDMDIRITNAINKLEILERDNLWGIAAWGISVFLQSNEFISSEETANTVFNTYKDIYNHYIIKLESVRKRMFPKECKKDWEME